MRPSNQRGFWSRVFAYMPPEFLLAAYLMSIFYLVKLVAVLRCADAR